MKLISWNVNGLRATVRKGFVDIFNDLDADVFCVQETKAQDDQVAEALKDIEGFHLFSNSAERKGYSGTAILSKTKPVSNGVDMGIEEHDKEGRVMHTEFGNFHLVNVYTPNSGSGLKRLDYRATWDEAFKDYLAKLQKTKPVILTGDLNVAHQAIDLARPKQNYNKTAGYTQVEIDGFENILSIGMKDTFRTLHPEEVAYTFWSQRIRGREKNIGWRLDYFVVSDPLMEKVKSSEILSDIQGSDHCPISLEVEF